MIQYILVIRPFESAEIDTIWELVKNAIVEPKNHYIVKNKKPLEGTKWIAKNHSKIITKEQNPEYFV